MCRLFLFFLFSFFISFNVVAGDDDNKNSGPTLASDFLDTDPSGKCTGSEKINGHCEKIMGQGNASGSATGSSAGGTTTGGTTTAAGGTGESGSTPGTCNSTPVSDCCSDPTNCLGGDKLSTFQDINSMVTKAGPGLAMAMQGMGKDMYKLCQAMQGLAAGGAGLSMAAKGACNKAISSCHSTCDDLAKQACTEYTTAQKECKQKSLACEGNFAIAFPAQEVKQCKEKEYKIFVETKQAKAKAENIADYDNEKKLCSNQRAKAKDLAENMGEMANSALSAELCKQQTQIPKKQCLKNGGKWVDMECIMPEEETEEEPETVALRGSDGTPIPQHTNAQMGISSESPSGDSQGKSSSNSDGNPDSGGGGNPGGPKPVSPLGLPGLAADTGLDSDSDSSTGTGPGRSGISGSSGLAGLGGGAGFSPYKRNQNNEEEEDDDDALSMGGGGFAGYGGGGGFGDGNAYASLGLSKKKLDELKKKKGAKRVTASEAKGTHQNIFERISKRFQSLCQSKLDCR